MKKYAGWVILAFFAFGFSKAVIATVIPVSPTVVSEAVVVVMDDDFLLQQGK